MSERLGVVLFNLGGPDSPAAVRPFLFNLFADPAIIGLPFGLRHLVAWLITRSRARAAAEIYRRLGGSSPLLAGTEAQAEALAAVLAKRGVTAKVVIAMRYWHPRAEKAASELAAWKPDRIVLLPLYPQFSTTTTESSFKEWRKVAKKAGLDIATEEIDSYPRLPGWVEGQADLLRRELMGLGEAAPVRVLFSAHGLPEKIVKGGDPYPRQVEAGARAIASTLGIAGVDWVVCYQSKVGPLVWIGPSTEAEIERAGREGKGVVVLPIAFVSEHSETLVELDHDYAETARRAGLAFYRRVAAIGTHPAFIAGLADLACQSEDGEELEA